MRYLIIEGRCGHEPEIRSAQSGTAILKMRVATNEREKRDGKWDEVTQWISVTTFGNRAEALSKILRKGSRIMARGKLDVREFDKKDGSRGYDIGIVADDLVLLDSKNSGGSSPSTGGGGDFPSDDFKDDPGGGSGDQFDGDDLPFVRNATLFGGR